ncbi:VWA domain-containing protein [Streptomyces flavofungini]|uniref:VWA domain-containing protein n=1 Tax=Streptomyces flavofungini TaxID=68200 RepID=UPI001E60199A|nr:VWA domain-containing protein [Streptomyces flavofungini]
MAIDVCAVLLTQSGTVRSDDDLVFYNHPAQDGVALAGQTISADLTVVPTSVDRIMIVASIDPCLPNVCFNADSTPRADIDCEGEQLTFIPPPLLRGETAAVLVEIYRRGGGWKVRAVGQGWHTGLVGLATDFGIVVDDAGSESHTTPRAGTAPSQTPAISLDKLQRSAPGLVNLYEAAQISLVKTGVMGQRAAVYLVLDHSGSMYDFYDDGTMQHLAEQALGLSANLDDDGTVPLVFFSHEVDLVTDISLENYRSRIDHLHKTLEWGGTCYAPAMQSVIDHYRHSRCTEPAFVIFQTDGDPCDRKETRDLLRGASSLPIFWQFVGFGLSRDLRFLRSLDTLDGRTVDSAGYFGAGQQPIKRADADLYARLMKEFPDWLTVARATGVIR